MIGINSSFTKIFNGFVSPDDLWYKNTNLLIGTVIGVFVPFGLVIFGTIGNIMSLAVFLRYQQSSKSSATFLMQALCVIDTVYLLSVLPTELPGNCYGNGLIRWVILFSSLFLREKNGSEQGISVHRYRFRRSGIQDPARLHRKIHCHDQKRKFWHIVRTTKRLQSFSSMTAIQLYQKKRKWKFLILQIQ